MSSIFSVTYENTTKKITCPSNSSINKLVGLSLLKFNVPSNTNACLLYNGKQLEGMRSIQSSNLLNNAKLELKRIDSSVPISIKINGLCLGRRNSIILKLALSTTIATLLNLYLEKSLEEIEWANYSIELGGMQSRMSNASTDFHTATVGNLVGTASSVALRLVIEDMVEKQLKEEAHREEELLRREKERQRIAAAMKSKEERENVDITETKLHDQHKTTKLSNSDGTRCKAGEEKDKEREPLVIPQEGSMGQTHSLQDSLIQPPIVERTQADVSPVVESLSTIETDSYKRPADGPGLSFVPREETEDTLYVPSGRIEMYENPDDDYVLTANHAEKYLKMIRGMQKPTKKTSKQSPNRYIIRLRFPDRKLLDLIMEDSTVPLGQLFKKLDSYVSPNFVNSYVLKNGSPPFETIQMSFSTNNVPLKEHPSFQQEKILLIWEPVISHPGPYLKEGLEQRDLKEMPTVALESNRQNLEDDSSSTRKANRADDDNEKAEKPNRKVGLPKWFRP